MAKDSVYTTGKVAKLCGVTINTVVKWFDAGELKGYRIPSSGDRRIPRDNLVEFMREHEFPLGELADTTTRILVVDDDPVVIDVIRRVLSREEDYDIEVASSGFQAGILAKGFKPHLIVLDIMLGDINGREVCQIIRNDPTLSKTKILAISGHFQTREEAAAFMDDMFDDYLPKPFDTKVLSRKIEKLAE